MVVDKEMLDEINLLNDEAYVLFKAQKIVCDQDIIDFNDRLTEAEQRFLVRILARG